MAIENFDPKEWSKQFLRNLEPGGHCICDGSRENGWQEIHVNPLCPIHGDVRDTGFVIDSKEDRITAIEDAIEELES